MIYKSDKLGDQIQYYRKLKKLSQKELAENTGLSKSYISDLECGRNKSLSVNTLRKISTSLGVTNDELLKSSLIKYNTDIKDDIPKDILNEIETLSLDQLILYDKIVQSFLERQKQIQFKKK